MRRPATTPDEEESEHLLAVGREQQQPAGAAGVSANATPATTQQNEQKSQGHSVVVIPTMASGQAGGDLESARRGSDAGSSAGSTSQKGKDADAGQCRICLEEDALRNLEVPCACAGTSKYAHHECIQVRLAAMSSSRYRGPSAHGCWGRGERCDCGAVHF